MWDKQHPLLLAETEIKIKENRIERKRRNTSLLIQYTSSRYIFTSYTWPENRQ